MSFYESHILSKELPIIFHRDQLMKTENEKCVTNWHENLEILYCIEGKGTAVINSRRINIEEGDLLVINSGDIHYVITEAEKTVYYCLIVSADFLREFGLNVEKVYFSEKVTDMCGLSFFEKIIYELYERRPYYQAEVKAQIISYVAYLCRNYVCQKREHYDNDKMKRGITYIREHFVESISVDMIAEATGFSRFYFSRQFKNITGMTVMKYVEFLRCHYAKGLLEQGISVSKAALECGFSDVSYFTKVFKRQYGVLPSKVR